MEKAKLHKIEIKKQVQVEEKDCIEMRMEQLRVQKVMKE